jgi:hypothetical protein
MGANIEKMNSIRKNIVRCIFVTSLIAFLWFILPFLGLGLVTYNYQRAVRAFEISAIFWLISLLVFGVINLFLKRKLNKAMLYDAVYDDRVKLSWLKAYRIAFFVAFISSICWKCYDNLTVEKQLTLEGYLPPNGPFFILYLAVISFAAAFLFFSRESKND